MLIYISIAAYSIAAVLIAVMLLKKYAEKKRMNPLEKELLKRRSEARGKKNRLSKTYQDIYQVYIKLPLIKTLAKRLMTSFTLIGEKDQRFLIRKVVQILSLLIFSYVLLIILFWKITGNLLYMGIFVFFLWYIAWSYLDFFVARGHLHLLEEFILFIGLVRQKYYEYGMVDDAIYEATQALGENAREMTVQGERIYEILVAGDSEKKMTEYGEMAPNPYLKMFLNFSYMTMEYGDQWVEGRSVYTTNLSFLSKNIYLEVDKRKRLNYALKSMNVIVMIPLLFMSLIKEWAISNFAPLGIFYRSPGGKYIEVITIVIMLLSMVLLNKTQNLEYSGSASTSWKKVLSRIALPLDERLKQKWLYGLSFFFLTLIIIVSIQWSARQKIKDMVYYDSQFLGATLKAEEVSQRLEESRWDFAFIKDSSRNTTEEEVRDWVESMDESEHRAAREVRISQKIKLYHSYYLRFWHVLIAVLIGIMAYHLPEMNDYMTKKMKHMDIDDEIAGFRSIIMMLMHHPRMNVEEITSWLEGYAMYYKEELHRCQLNLSSGEYVAFMELHRRVEEDEMKRIIYQLAMASEDITLEEAFDELLQEKANFFEQRKWQNEKLINRKMIIGQNIGFLPAYSLIILYMIVPMIITSTRELEGFFSQMMP